MIENVKVSDNRPTIESQIALNKFNKYKQKQ